MDPALLQAPPSQHAWKQICDALDALEGRELDKAIADVDAALEDWPDSQRYGNQWARSLAANGAEPRLRVARSLNLTGCRGSKTVIESVAGSADIAHLKTLIFSLVPISPKKMKILAASPHLAGVEMMRFSMCYMKDTGFSHFSKSTTIQSLRRLEVGNNDLGERGGKIVATAKTDVFSKLESLSYANNKIGTAGCVHLAKAKLPTLRSLDLSRNEVGSEGLAALGASETLTGLCELTLSDFQQTPAMLDGLAGTPLLSRLEALRWTGDSEEGGAMLPRFFALEGFQGLRVLEVTYQHLVDDDLLALASLEHSTLETLKIQNAKFTKKGIEALAKSPALANVSVLELSGCGLDDGAAVALLRSPHLKNLRRLGLSGDAVGDAVVGAALDASFTGTLEYLSLHNTSVSDAGAQAIAKSTALARLAHLELTQTKIGDAGATAIAGAAGLGKLLYLGFPTDELGGAAKKALRHSKHLSPSAKSGLRLD
jgi:hypothetical protein